MNEEKESRNMNITVRVTQSNYKDFNRLANALGLSVSTWANYILSHHDKVSNYYKQKRLILKFLDDAIKEKRIERDDMITEIENCDATDSNYQRLLSKKSAIISLIFELIILKRRFDNRFKNY